MKLNAASIISEILKYKKEMATIYTNTDRE
jgi:hypothetical protein